MIIDTLKHCKSVLAVTSLYYDKDDSDKHLTGFVTGYDDEYILVAHITDRGLYDGYIVKQIKDIFQVDYDGPYENKIKNLYEIKEQSHLSLAFSLDTSQNMLLSIIGQLTGKDCIVTVELSETLVSGYIRAHDNYSLDLLSIDDRGDDNGISTILIDGIETMYIDTDTEQDLKLLRNAFYKSTPTTSGATS